MPPSILSITMKFIDFLWILSFLFGCDTYVKKQTRKVHVTKSCGLLQVDLVYFRRVIIKPSSGKLCDIDILGSGRGGKFIHMFYLLEKNMQ